MNAFEARALIDASWLETLTGTRLHAAADGLTDDSAVDVVMGGSAQVRLACGPVAIASIPGLGARLDAARCDACCATAGLRPGSGSPKNIEVTP